jgi:hypothetical protein
VLASSPCRCDAVLRVGGPSAGADLMVEMARRHGLAVYYELSEIPDGELAIKMSGP